MSYKPPIHKGIGNPTHTGKRGKYGVPEVVATCTMCGEKSRPVVGASPAASLLTGMEVLGKDGWRYAVGFTAMATGDHRPVCPKCAAVVQPTT